MGCFLACFGFSSRRKKRRKPPKRVLVGDKSHGGYEPLDSYVRVDLSVSKNENPADSCNSPPSNKRSKVKIIKKVRFDLNVRAYEPIPPEDTSPRWSESDEEQNKGKGRGQTVDPTIAIAETDTFGSVGGAHGQPLNYRYQNCIDSYDEVEELVYQDFDFEDAIESDDELDFFDDLGDNSGFDDSRASKETGQPRFSNLLPKLEEQAPLFQLTGNAIQEMKTISYDENAYRSKHIHPVLTPVENVVQWKKIKAKEAPPSRQQLKENIELDQKIRLPLSSELNSNSALLRTI